MADRSNAEIKRAHLASPLASNKAYARFLQRQQLRIITLLLCLTLTLIGSVNLDLPVGDTRSL